METLLLKKGFWRNLVLFTALSFTTVIFGKTKLVDNNLHYLRASPTIYSDRDDYYSGGSKLITTANGLSSGLNVEVIFKGNDDPTTTVLTRTLGTNPSACGGSVTFTATVSNAGQSNNNPKCGSVTFYDGPISNGITIGTGDLTNGPNGNVVAFTTSSLSPGVTHTITAVYSPSGSNCKFLGSTSFPVSHVVNAPTEAVFSTHPADITVSCGAIPTLSSLSYTNGLTGLCGINGSVPSTQSAQIPSGICGGVITETWTFTDAFSRTITHSRTIRVNPPEVASFDPVIDITVDCGAATTSSLAYTNGKMGDCEIKGSVTSTLSVQDPAGYCGGDITESWTYTDNCNRTITASRIIHVRPAAEASFASVSDINVDCGAATRSSLDYTNGRTGNCEIKGSVTSTLSDQDPAGYCGG
ncbi:Ig-like domain-containing protein, partial [Flavobacterium enshiense]